MIDVRKDLIEKELEYHNLQFNSLKLTKRFISWLFRHYTTVEFSYHWYDSEPEVPEEWDQDGDEWDNLEFRKIWYQLVREYEPLRITRNNWIDPFGPGIWSMNSKQVDSISKEAMINVRKTSVKKKGRLHIAHRKTEDVYFIYWYGRDFMKVDYWWVMKRRGSKFEKTKILLTQIAVKRYM